MLTRMNLPGLQEKLCMGVKSGGNEEFFNKITSQVTYFSASFLLLLSVFSSIIFLALETV